MMEPTTVTAPDQVRRTLDRATRAMAAIREGNLPDRLAAVTTAAADLRRQFAAGRSTTCPRSPSATASSRTRCRRRSPPASTRRRHRRTRGMPVLPPVPLRSCSFRSRRGAA
jgi:hypothetical protein